MLRHLLFSLFAVVLLSTPAHAKRFRNAYVSFELPPNWTCNLDGTEWVCVNEFSPKAKEAIIILTAKEVGPADTIPAYLAHVQQIKTIPGPDKQPIKSKILHAKERQIAGHIWVDALHEGSEVASYYTRYLATVKDKIAILVTFSAHRSHYTKYSADFIKAIESLRVVATKDLLSDKPQVPSRTNQETIGAPIGSSVPVDLTPTQLPEESSSAMGGNAEKFLGLILLLAAIGFYFFMKRSKKTKSSSTKKPGPKK